MAALSEKYRGGGKKASEEKWVQYRHACKTCGAVRVDEQIGLEATPEEYTAAMVEVFREVRRVLRSDGTLWINIGDSYNGQGTREASIQENGTLSYRAGGRGFNVPGLKSKDLCGIPWRLALALQADGWWLRQDIIWHKPNPMPESVKDRCTKAHEYIFLLTKAEKYYYNAPAIFEPTLSLDPDHPSYRPNSDELGKGGERKVYSGKHQRSARAYNPEGRNRRSVWSIATTPYPGAHFATFPEELPRICLLAGCPEGGTVLDPFGGAGTTGLVADQLGRDAILIELNPDYAAIAEKRIRGASPLLVDVSTSSPEKENPDVTANP